MFDQTCGSGGSDLWIGLTDEGAEAGTRRDIGWYWASGADPSFIRGPGAGYWFGGEPNNLGGENFVHVMPSQRMNDLRGDNGRSICCEVPRGDLGWLPPPPPPPASLAPLPLPSSLSTPAWTASPSRTTSPSASLTSSLTPGVDASRSGSPTPDSATRTASASSSSSPSATPTPSVTASASRGHSEHCPPGWFAPPESVTCFKGIANAGASFEQASAQCAALAPGASLAAVRSEGEAAFVLGASCGLPSPPSADEWGVWLGLQRAPPAADDGDAALPRWRWVNNASTDFLYSPPGRANWMAHEPSELPGEGCGFVSAGGLIDDVPCWIEPALACCELPFAVPSAAPTPSPSESVTATATRTVSPSAAAWCDAAATYRALARTDLDGDFLGVQVVATRRDCELACCADAGCHGFALARASRQCFLFANVTMLGISSLLDSGLKWGALA